MPLVHYNSHFVCCAPLCVLQEALRYHNQTSMQLGMLEFSKQRLVSDDEVSAFVQLHICMC